jgi:hypothetical protein
LVFLLLADFSAFRRTRRSFFESFRSFETLKSPEEAGFFLAGMTGLEKETQLKCFS